MNISNPKVIRTMSEISDKIIDIIQDLIINAEEYSTSDLQGAIEAQVLLAMQAGEKLSH